MNGEDQPAASQMSEMDTPLDHAQDEAMLLVEWALTPMGHCNHEEEYAYVIASTNHLQILCFVTGPPLAWLPKPTKSCSDEAECSMNILRALAGQSRDSWLPVRGENAESVITFSHLADAFIQSDLQLGVHKAINLEEANIQRKCQ